MGFPGQIQLYSTISSDAFRIGVQVFIETFFYTKVPLHLKKWLKQDRLENGKKSQITTHLKEESQSKAWKAAGELQETNETTC